MLKTCLYKTYRAFPLAAQITDTGISVATFISVSDEDAGVELDEAALSSIVCGAPVIPTAPSTPPFAWVNGTVLSPIQVGQKFKINGHVKLDAEALRAAAADHSTVALLASQHGDFFAPFNRTAAKVSGLTRPFHSSSDPDKVTVALGRVGFLAQGWKGTQTILHGDRDQGLIVFDEHGKRIEIPDYTDDFKNPEPTLHFLPPDQPLALGRGGMVDIGIECRNADGARCTQANVMLHVSTTSGFAPKSQVLMLGGIAKIRVMALGIDAGDTVGVHAGWGVTPEMAKITLPVVA